MEELEADVARLTRERDAAISGVGKANREVGRLQGVVDKLPKCWRLVDGKLKNDCVVIPFDTRVFAWCEVGDSETHTPRALVEATIYGGPDKYNGGWWLTGTGDFRGMEFAWEGMGTDSPWFDSPEAYEAWRVQREKELDVTYTAMGEQMQHEAAEAAAKAGVK